MPIVGEPLGAAERYGADRCFVVVTLAGDPDRRAGGPGRRARAAPAWAASSWSCATRTTSAREFIRWEVATAAAGIVLGIDPFDQPNVQESKDATEARCSRRTAPGRASAAGTARRRRRARRLCRPAVLGDAPVAVDGAVACSSSACRGRATTSRSSPTCRPTMPSPRASSACAVRVRDALGVATTLGFGPRFLHSTGQLHKGGPASGVFLQLTADPERDLPIPGWDESFGTLIAAQALGDLTSLQKRGRRGASAPRDERGGSRRAPGGDHQRRARQLTEASDTPHSSGSTVMQIGIAGLGRMGAGMARRLARGGHDVVAWNRTEQVAIDVAAEPENGGRITVAEPVERLRDAAQPPAPRPDQRAVRRRDAAD